MDAHGQTGRRRFVQLSAAALAAAASGGFGGGTPKRPSIVLIYADDLGYGDLGCYGATRVRTPNVDRVAAEGRRFVNAHAPAATCTPSRYSLLTGEYAFRRKGTNVLPGDARLIIEPGRTTLASVLKAAGYATGVVGKWHLGLGAGDLDWNGEIQPGPEDIGFDYAFLVPATGDRVPCVYVERRRVVGFDPADPIRVSYGEMVGTDPTGMDHPELLEMKPSHGHDQTIVNGISRIGFMSGGKAARWVDQEMADTLTSRAVSFVERNRDHPFFLYFATHDVHVPRVPHPRFAGQSGMGPRGDAIVQFDWSAGEILKALDRLGLAGNTLVILTSDNGPVVDDGYADRAVELLGDHKPGGPLRGGKYSAFDAGTRVPFLLRWPGQVKPGSSDALVCQIDLLASFATLTGLRLAPDDAPDSLDMLGVLTGSARRGRETLVEQAGALSLIAGGWKYIEPNRGQRVSQATGIELGNDPLPQLYNLADDIGETRNLAGSYPERVGEMASRLKAIRDRGRSR